MHDLSTKKVISKGRTAVTCFIACFTILMLSILIGADIMASPNDPMTDDDNFTNAMGMYFVPGL